VIVDDYFHSNKFFRLSRAFGEKHQNFESYQSPNLKITKCFCLLSAVLKKVLLTPRGCQ
jgi:hypothetical protein